MTKSRLPINEGHVEFVGNDTLRGGGKVYKGNRITISTLQDGECHTMLESFIRYG